MELPTIRTVLTDSGTNIRYEALAYRELAQDEMVIAIRHFLASCKKKPKPGSTIEIMSIIGSDTVF